MDNELIELINKYFDISSYSIEEVEGHEGGRNLIYICKENNNSKYILRVSLTNDRTYSMYEGEVEFVHYLASNGASVSDVIPSRNNRLVEVMEYQNTNAYVSMFEFAKGMLICDNGYEYREGAPLEEYFYNTGKVLGSIHKLSKTYKGEHKRLDYFDKYNMAYINELISDKYKDLKIAISKRFDKFKELECNNNNYGLVHFDFSDGNYHIDMSNGDITVFDFDNCMYCWYMYDLANLWIHGTGWCQFEEDPKERASYMEHYFNTILEGYRSETSVDDSLLKQLPLFIDMVLIENIVDEFECCELQNEEVDYEDIADEAETLINNIPYAGFLE